MNKLVILCVLAVCCLSLGAAQRGDYGRRFPWPRPPRPDWPTWPSRGCRDHRGRPVAPGGSYYDGCNWCRCGTNGVLSVCTMRFCPSQGFPQVMKTLKPIRLWRA